MDHLDKEDTEAEVVEEDIADRVDMEPAAADTVDREDRVDTALQRVLARAQAGSPCSSPSDMFFCMLKRITISGSKRESLLQVVSLMQIMHLPWHPRQLVLSPFPDLQGPVNKRAICLQLRKQH